ncbi:MAG: carbohydrate ABC transporter permease [Chloroflexi bacterium]|nr:carbohydrate ABC transporter permease [Chloroflexota bacterium]MCY4246923.1 carbohydrate ABC transporter permease [Chloroflexota bacterium]
MVGGRAQLRGAKLLTWVALIAGACFAGLPALWMVASAFKSNLAIFAYPPALIDHSFSFNAYLAVLGDARQLRFFFNSYLVALLVTICTVVASILAGYSFSRYDFRFKRFLTLVIIGVQSVPPITLMIPYFGLIVWLGLYNSYAALVLTYMVFTLSYAIIMMTGYFNTLPRDLDEAVMIDGGGSFVTLWRILVPISLPGIVSVGVYTFMLAWNEFLFALTLTRTNDMRTVPIGIHLLMGQHSFEWNQMMALSVLGSLPVLILFLLFQRYFIAGMSAGSIKG